MSDSVSRHRPFSFIFNWRNKAKSQGAKAGEQGEWETIIMLLLVTNSVVFRDVWAGELPRWRSNSAHVQIFWYDLLVNSTADPNGICKLMDCLATDFLDKFMNISFCWCLGTLNVYHLQLALERL
jgi:hypothetical protein